MRKSRGICILALILSTSTVLCSCEKQPATSPVSASETVSETVTSQNDVSKEDTSKEDTGKEVVSVSESKEVTSDIPAPIEEETDPVLRDALMNKYGWHAGCAATEGELNDPKVWEIITTHFDRLTIGNELKPDALVNYSVTTVPGTKTEELNGESMVVPVLNFDRAERMLNKIYDWNKENPDRAIKVRGHVLLWHSQTPEWFFHVDYDKKKEYVDKDTMNKRLEWYIKTVLTHFTGEDSKYKDLFYGWDVVNEAISDGTNTYRSDKENPNESLSEDRHGSNSSWWHVYNSNEFIINAFKYANKYAPASLELYYNDYNDTNTNKMKGIIELLEAVKAEEGEPGVGTRITGMGMQGHYGMDNPSQSAIVYAIKSYAKVVGMVQLTEVDISASSTYKGEADQKDEENEKLQKRYKEIRRALTEACTSDYVDFQGITFWGTVDHYSWLQSRSNIGGGNTTGLPQMPLLFDENYEKKPCFYSFAD